MTREHQDKRQHSLPGPPRNASSLALSTLQCPAGTHLRHSATESHNFMLSNVPCELKTNLWRMKCVYEARLF